MTDQNYFPNCFLFHRLSKLNKGNLINWEDSQWILDPGMVWIEREMKEICLLPQPKDIAFPEYRTNADLNLLCNKLKGHISVADSQSKMDDLIEEFKMQLPDAMNGYQTCMYGVLIICLCR